MKTTNFEIAAANSLANYYERHPEKLGGNKMDYVVSTIDQDDPNQINSVRLSFKGKPPTTQKVLDLFKKKYNTNTHFLFSFEWDHKFKEICKETLWDANQSYVRRSFTLVNAITAVILHLLDIEEYESEGYFTSPYFVVGVDNSKELSIYIKPLVTTFEITDNHFALKIFQERPQWKNEYLIYRYEELMDFVPVSVPRTTPTFLVRYDKTELN